MKLKTTVQKENEVDIKVPSFWKEPNPHGLSMNAMIAILNEKTICKISESEDLTQVANMELWLAKNDIINASLNWEEITEQEFLAMYERALTSMSLTPQLVKGGSEDDLNGVLNHSETN